MTFAEAYTKLMEGSAIRRPSYPTGCGFKLSIVHNAIMCITDGNVGTEVQCWSFNSADFRATDWETLE